MVYSKERISSSEKTSSAENHNTDNTLSVLLVVDEEFRDSHPNWQFEAVKPLEKVNTQFEKQFNVNFQVKSLGEWESVGLDSEEILNDLNFKWNKYNFDFVIGITGDVNFEKGGAANIYSFPPKNSGISVVKDQGSKTWQSLMHELSHNFGVGHDDIESEIVCIMNYKYLYSVETWDQNHSDQIIQNMKWYTKNNK